MKKATSTLLFIAFAFSSPLLRAQSCNNQASVLCTPSVTLTNAGFIDPDSVPCIIQGSAYDYAIPIKMFSTFTVLGSTYSVDSVQFVGINNLPCGLCWSTSLTSNTYAANQNGCIRILGTSTDSAGQYKLSISLRAWINHLGGSGELVPPSQVDASGIKLFLRLKSSSIVCIAVDTSSSADNLTANPSRCITGIPDLAGYISAFDVFPNPLNYDAVMSFTAIKSGIYTIQLTDVAGKVIRVKQIEATLGENKAAFQRQNLPAGMYFVSISNGMGTVTESC